MFDLSGRSMAFSGIHTAAAAGLGFFGAQALHLGAAVAIGSAATAVGAGFVGGLILYCPLVFLKELGKHSSILTTKYYYYWAAIETAALFGALPLGALVLGLPVLPFLMCATVALAVYFTLNLIGRLCGATKNISDYVLESNLAESIGSRFYS